LTRKGDRARTRRERSPRIFHRSSRHLLVPFRVEKYQTTHKHNFAQRRSVDVYPDFETAKRAVDADLNSVTWQEVEQ
jgi:hypothetical protein